MVYKIIDLKSRTAPQIKTEILYEVASAHVAGLELLRVNISREDEVLYKRAYTALIRTLKRMKSDGTIQFLANAESFELNTTEAQFLCNKYPHLFEQIPVDTDTEGFVYVRV